MNQVWRDRMDMAVSALVLVALGFFLYADRPWYENILAMAAFFAFADTRFKR